MRADRLSALTQWEHALPLALAREFDGGLEALREEGVEGAAKFAGGAGRHGHFE